MGNPQVLRREIGVLGAIFLGLKGPVVKSHGSTDSVGFYHSIDLCYKIVKGNLVSKIKNNLSHINENK